MHVRRIKVALFLKELIIAEKIIKTRHYVDSMGGNANFPSPTPPLANVTTAVDEMETAAEDAVDGSKEDTAILHEKEVIHDTLVTALGHYVEDVANANPETAESVALSSGMDVRKVSEPIGPLPAPNNLTLDFGEHSGTLTASCDPVKGANVYIFLFAEETETIVWMMQGDWDGVSTSSKFLITGLTKGTEYRVKVAAVGAAGRSPWSDVAIHLSP